MRSPGTEEAQNSGGQVGDLSIYAQWGLMDLAEEGEILLRKWEGGKEGASWVQALTVKRSGTCQQVVKPKVAWSQSWWKYLHYEHQQTLQIRASPTRAAR